MLRLFVLLFLVSFVLANVSPGKGRAHSHSSALKRNNEWDLSSLRQSFVKRAGGTINVLWYNGGGGCVDPNVIASFAPTAPGGNTWVVTEWNSGPMPAGTFNVLVVASPGEFFCGIDPTALTAANLQFNPATDRIFITGQDADYHYTNGEWPNGQNNLDGPLGFLLDAINWAGSGSTMGYVGLLQPGSDLTCGYGSATVDLGTGFSVVSCDNSDGITIPPGAASDPVNSGLDSNGLSNWASSDHIQMVVSNSQWTGINIVSVSVSPDKRSESTVYATILSSAFASAQLSALEDPLLIGFYGQRFNFDGYAGMPFHMFSDRFVSVNALFSFADPQRKFGTVMSAIGVRWAAEHSLVVDIESIVSSNGSTKAQVQIDGGSSLVLLNNNSPFIIPPCYRISWAYPQLTLQIGADRTLVITAASEHNEHINTKFFDLQMDVPMEEASVCGGALGQTAQKNRTRFETDPRVFVVKNLLAKHSKTSEFTGTAPHCSTVSSTPATSSSHVVHSHNALVDAVHRQLAKQSN